LSFEGSFDAGSLIYFVDSMNPPVRLGRNEGLIKLAMGLIATMTALVLGLVISTAKSSRGLMKVSSAPMPHTLSHLGK
jgi:hypothetical protein